MRAYSKLLLPLVISTMVACASNQEPEIEIAVKGARSTDNQPVMPLVKESKNETRSGDIKESPVNIKDDSIGTTKKLTESGQRARLAQLSHEASNIIQMPSRLAAHAFVAGDAPVHYYQDEGRENYASIEQNPVKQVLLDPVSTFSIDVDTGSYTNIRRMLNQGRLPPVDAVRVEEMINYFKYASYETPDLNNGPFSINTEISLSPWSSQHALLRIGLKGYEPVEKSRPASNLVFLLDVSGSMNSPNKLPLLKKSLIMLSKQLKSTDKVSIVVYAGASGVVLEPTNGNQTLEIEQALENLSAGGSTNGQAGIQLAYSLAQKEFQTEGINRVILATDGDFNVGTTDVDALKRLIEKKRKEGIALTTLGFGTGNYNDELMEQLADVGNGNYAYIDNLNEARKVLVEELSSTLMTIAKDVKIQIEFNPSVVKEYRLLGYENRSLRREDFNNDSVDAGEIGAGHSVTALYELVLQGSDGNRVDPLRYQEAQSDLVKTQNSISNELAFVKFRYKELNAETSKLISLPIKNTKKINKFENASSDFRFAATVAEFGEVLRGSKYVENVEYNAMINQALNAKGSDQFGYRSEFIQLLRLASTL